MIIVAGDSEWVAIIMATIKLVGYQKEMATDKMMTMAASNLTQCSFLKILKNVCEEIYYAKRPYQQSSNFATNRFEVFS